MSEMQYSIRRLYHISSTVSFPAAAFALRAPLEHESLCTVVRECSVTFSLWRATQKGIRCLEMWIFCLFLFNTFVFETTFVFCSETKVAFFFCLVFSLRRAIGGLPRKGAKLFALRGSATLEHESLRTAVREVFAYIYGAPKSPRFRRGLLARHKEACPARGQSSSLRSSTNPCALSCARSSRTFMARQKAPAFDGGFWRAIRNSNP